MKSFSIQEIEDLLILTVWKKVSFQQAIKEYEDLLEDYFELTACVRLETDVYVEIEELLKEIAQLHHRKRKDQAILIVSSDSPWRERIDKESYHVYNDIEQLVDNGIEL